MENCKMSGKNQGKVGGILRSVISGNPVLTELSYFSLWFHICDNNHSFLGLCILYCKH